MRKTTRNLLLASLFLFSLSLGSCSLGVEYDQRNKLFVESDNYGDLSIAVYGKRWERIGDILCLFGLTLDIAAVLIWYRGKHKEDKSILELAETNE